MNVIPEYFPTLELMSRLMSATSYSFELSRPNARQSFQNRTKIRLPDRCHWLTVPVRKKETGTPLSEMEIDYAYPWVQDHLKGLKYNYATAPFYDHFIPSITHLLRGDYQFLHELTSETVNWAIRAAGLHTSLCLPKVDSSDSKAVSPKEQVDVERAHDAVYRIPSLRPSKPYRQNFPGFIPGPGVLDLIFNHGPAAITHLG